MKTLKLTEEEMAKQMVSTIFNGMLRNHWAEYEHAFKMDVHDYLNQYDDLGIEMYAEAISIAQSLVKLLFSLEKGKTHRLLNRIEEVNIVLLFINGEMFEFTASPYCVQFVSFEKTDDAVFEDEAEVQEESQAG